MEENTFLNESKFSSLYTAEMREKDWEELTVKLNALENGAEKNRKQWQKSWTGYKSRVKLHAKALQAERRTTGGGVGKLKPLSEIDERLLGLIEPEAFGLTIPEVDIKKDQSEAFGLTIPEVDIKKDQSANPDPATPGPSQYSTAHSPSQYSMAQSPSQLSSAHSPSQFSSAHSPSQFSDATGFTAAPSFSAVTGLARATPRQATARAIPQQRMRVRGMVLKQNHSQALIQVEKEKAQALQGINEGVKDLARAFNRIAAVMESCNSE